jgi:hypothetical protein
VLGRQTAAAATAALHRLLTKLYLLFLVSQVSVLNKPMQLCSYTFVVSAGRGVSSTLSHAGSAAPSATTSWEGCLAARRRSHTEASSSAVATIDSQSPHYLVRSQQELVGLRRQHAAQRMRNRYKKLNPLERAAAIAHEDLVANSSLGGCQLLARLLVWPPALGPLLTQNSAFHCLTQGQAMAAMHPRCSHLPYHLMWQHACWDPQWQTPCFSPSRPPGLYQSIQLWPPQGAKQHHPSGHLGSCSQCLLSHPRMSTWHLPSSVQAE